MAWYISPACPSDFYWGRALVNPRAGRNILALDQVGHGLARHLPGGPQNVLKSDRISLLRHDAADAGLLALGELEPRARIRILSEDVRHEHADGQRSGRRKAGDVHADVEVCNLAGVERIDQHAVEAEQLSQALPIDRKAGGAAGRAAERRQVDPGPGLAIAIGFPTEASK